jgi:hypothetical protein
MESITRCGIVHAPAVLSVAAREPSTISQTIAASGDVMRVPSGR